MEDFVRKVIKGDGCTPLPECINAFESKFSSAVNVEWHTRGENYEAVFYKNKIEHVALFSPSGELSEYKLLLREDYLPARIIDLIKSRGEIMNAVLRNKGNKLEYELIIMDRDMKRSLFLFSEQGKILSISEL